MFFHESSLTHLSIEETMHYQCNACFLILPSSELLMKHQTYERMKEYELYNQELKRERWNKQKMAIQHQLQLESLQKYYPNQFLKS